MVFNHFHLSRGYSRGQGDQVNFTLMTHLAINSDTHMELLDLCYIAVSKASLIAVGSNQLPDATIVVSLTILLSSAGVTQMPKMLEPKVRVIAVKAMANV